MAAATCSIISTGSTTFPVRSAVRLDASTVGVAAPSARSKGAGVPSSGAADSLFCFAISASGGLADSLAVRPSDASSTKYFQGDFIVRPQLNRSHRHPLRGRSATKM
ncbi:hypothetical protein D9M68_474130 [compost metagenome]